MSNTHTTYGIISIDSFLQKTVLVDYVYDQLTLSSWEVNALSASYHLSVGLKGTSVDIYDDVSDNTTYVFFVNGSSYFQGNCKINQNLNILGNLNVEGDTIFDKEVTVTNMNIIDDLTVYNNSYFNSNMSVTGIVDISSNLIVRDDVLLHTKLNVSGNASFYSDVYVNNNVLVNNNVSINGITDISNSLIVKGPVSFNSSLDVIGKSSFHDNVIMYSNLSSPTLYISDKATIHNLNAIDDTSLNTLYVNNNSIFNSSINGLKNTSLNTLYVTNNASFNDGFYIKQTAVITNLSVPNNSTLNSLNVNGKTTLANTDINALNVINTLNISGTLLTDALLHSRNKVYIGPNDLMSSLYPESKLDVQASAFIGTLYATKIRCNDMQAANTSTNALVNLGITDMSIINTTDISGNIYTPIYGKYIFGTGESPVLTITNTYGVFSHGLLVYNNPYGANTYNTVSYFDLSANAQTIGITYNGPVNIGMTTPNVFNLNATGFINYDGSMNINQYTTSSINLNGNGVINYDGSMNIGQNDLTTQFNLNGNGVINYDGSMNIGQTSLSEFNLNASGIMKYDGIINIGSSSETYLDICANSLTSGIKYNGPIDINSPHLDIVGDGMFDYTGIINMNGPIYIEHDGDVTLDVIGNTKMDGNLLLGGNITSYSDIRIKDNICKLTSCLSKIDHISGYSFTRKDLVDKDKIYIGLIAQEVEEYFPDLVTETKDIKSINYQSMVAILLECIKELKREINELKIK